MTSEQSVETDHPPSNPSRRAPNGQDVAGWSDRDTPLRDHNQPRSPGRLKGRIRISKDFDTADRQIAEWFQQDD